MKNELPRNPQNVPHTLHSKHFDKTIDFDSFPHSSHSGMMNKQYINIKQDRQTYGYRSEYPQNRAPYIGSTIGNYADVIGRHLGKKVVSNFTRSKEKRSFW